MNTVLLVHTFVFEGVQHNTYHADINQGLPKHEHEYAHATQVHSGRIIVRKENITRELTKESPAIVLKEREWHEIEALEDNTVFVNIFKQGV